MGTTNYLAKAILKHVLNLDSLSSGVFLALGTSAPSVTDEDSWSGELSGSGYERQPVSFSNATGVESSLNTSDVWFPEATANWGSVSHYALWSAKSGGKLLLYAPLGTPPSPVTINTGEVLRVKPGQLTVGPGSGYM